MVESLFFFFFSFFSFCFVFGLWFCMLYKKTDYLQLPSYNKTRFRVVKNFGVKSAVCSYVSYKHYMLFSLTYIVSILTLFVFFFFFFEQPKVTIALLDQEELRPLAHMMNSYPSILKEKAILAQAAIAANK